MRVDKLVPHIRFKGFEEKWSRKRIKDIVNIQAGGDLDKNKLEKNGKYPVIGNTQKNNGILGFLNTYKINAPAVTVTGRGEIGHASFQSIPFTPVVRILALSNKNEKLNMRFLSLAIDNINFFIESTGVPQLTAPQLGVFKVRLPRVEEQKKIGNLFAKLDRLLDLQQQKLDQLELLKKALLQKLFPKQDAKIPELRFKGFEEEWKKKKFLNCLTKIIDYRGRTPKKLGQKWSDDGKYRALSALNVKNGYIDKNNDVHFGDFNLYKKWMGKSDLKKGDILFTTEAPMGNVAIINDNEKYILSQRTIAFRVDQKFFNNLFLSYILRTTTVNNKLKSLSTGGTAQGVSQKSLSYLVLMVTNNAYEQQKIGNLLAKVDRLIELENKKFSNLKQIKKSLLQNMFVE